MPGMEGKVTRLGARSGAGLAFGASEHGVLGSRPVDGPTADGSERINESQNAARRNNIPDRSDKIYLTS